MGGRRARSRGRVAAGGRGESQPAGGEDHGGPVPVRPLEPGPFGVVAVVAGDEDGAPDLRHEGGEAEGGGGRPVEVVDLHDRHSGAIT